MRAIALVLAMIPMTSMAAGPYLEVGLGHAQLPEKFFEESGKQWGSYPSQPQAGPRVSTSNVAGPFAIVEVGYGIATWHGETSVSAFHLSSVATGRDRGVNFIGVTHRFGGGR